MFKKFLFIKTVIALIAISLILPGCYSTTKAVKNMYFGNSGVVIEAADKKFTINPGEQIKTPFLSVKERGSVCYLPNSFLGWLVSIPVTAGTVLLYTLGCTVSGSAPYGDIMVPDYHPKDSYYEKYSATWALKNGAKRVKITNTDGKIYDGVLMIMPILEGAKGPIIRSYEINIPKESFSDASGGKIAVVSEPYDAEYGGYKGWILWFSDRPIE